MRVSKMESDNTLICLGTGIAGRRETAGLTRRQIASKVQLKTRCDLAHHRQFSISASHSAASCPRSKK